MRESPIEAHLVRRAKEVGGEIRKVQWAGRRGAPDRLLMLPYILVWVETKATDGVLEPHQEREHRRMSRMGQIVKVAASVEAVDEIVEAALRTSRTMQLFMEGVKGHA